MEHSDCSWISWVSLIDEVYLSWPQFCDLKTEGFYSSRGPTGLMQRSLANFLGQSTKLAPLFLMRQSQAGPENVYLTL